MTDHYTLSSDARSIACVLACLSTIHVGKNPHVDDKQWNRIIIWLQRWRQSMRNELAGKPAKAPKPPSQTLKPPVPKPPKPRSQA